MDNIEKIDYEFDTSFLIGYEAQERGYDIFYYNPKDLFIKENTIQASGYYLELLLDEKNYYNSNLFVHVKQCLHKPQERFKTCL